MKPSTAIKLSKNQTLVSRLLCVATTNGRGGYSTEFGTCTFKDLINLITMGDDNYCDNHGHIKHDTLDLCILCGKKMDCEKN